METLLASDGALVFVRAFLVVLAVFAATFILTIALPGSETEGYVLREDGSGVQVYRLNGLRVLFACIGLAVSAAVSGIVPATFLYDNFLACAASACLIGLLLSAFFFVRGRALLAADRIDRRARCPTSESLQQSQKQRKALPTAFDEFNARGPLEHFYCGLSEFNPRLAGVDIKIWLYVVGATQLQLNLLSCVWAHVQLRRTAGDVDGVAIPYLGGTLSCAMAAYAGCLTLFVCEYMYFEKVHLWTYDLFRERIGFKLMWGCLCFYAFFYDIGVFALVPRGGDISPLAAAACVALYLCGWLLTRGANLQKFACKMGDAVFCGGLIPMTYVKGSNNRLLCSGFWALSRHINYAGEIIQAVALALPGALATGSAIPWLYPAYYLALFIPRQMDDDVICAAKYTAPLWAAYCQAVPWRIMPFIW